MHGTPMHALGAASNPRADCFSGERSAASFYLALHHSCAFKAAKQSNHVEGVKVAPLLGIPMPFQRTNLSQAL